MGWPVLHGTTNQLLSSNLQLCPTTTHCRLRAIGWSGHGAVTGARARGQMTDRGSPHARALIGHANPTSTDRRLARAVTGMGTQRARKPKEHKQATARAARGTGTQRACKPNEHKQATARAVRGTGTQRARKPKEHKQATAWAARGTGTQRARKSKEHKQATARAVRGTGTQRARALNGHEHSTGTSTRRARALDGHEEQDEGPDDEGEPGVAGFVAPGSPLRRR